MSDNVQRPIRVLHIFKRMDRGGAETWIVNVLKSIDRARFQFDFLVDGDAAGVYDEEIRQLGGQVIPGPSPGRPWSYAPEFMRLVKMHGPYDGIHSHVHHFSGVTLFLAKLAGIPVRIAHSHNDLRSIQSRSNVIRRLYYRLSEEGVKRFSSVGLAASEDAAISLFGPGWYTDDRFRIVHCGIDLCPFSVSHDVAGVRDELGIPSDAVVVGHVGSFTAQKNHGFLLDVFVQYMMREPRAYLVLIGSGDRRTLIERKSNDLGISHRVLFLGSRNDVPRLMNGAMDVFVFPSLYEGLGLVLVEAQAAGLPSVISDTIPEEADVVPELVTRMSLAQSAAKWAEMVPVVLNDPIDSCSAIKAIEISSFNVKHSILEVLMIYRTQPVNKDE